jgi:methyl-accepting chemotaxis protein
MIRALPAAVDSTGLWAGVPYAPVRLYATLGFMLVVVGAGVAVVRVRVASRLLGDIASTLGIFLLAIGTIVYTVAFRGLRPLELAVAWLLSGIAIVWFVVRLNRMMMRPVTLLESLGDAVKRGRWSALLAAEGDASVEVPQALKDVALLIGETQKKTAAVLAASAQVARIGNTVADGAEQVTAALSGVTSGADRGLAAARGIRGASEQLLDAAGKMQTAARETLDISGSVERSAQSGVEHAATASQSVHEVAEMARDLRAGIAAVRGAATTVAEITHVVSDIVRQTNLLALNASIEAARAGEHGRGLAVVAEEVGKLAAESGAALRRIEELVQQMTRRTEDAVQHVGRMDVAVADSQRVMADALAVFHGIETDARRTLAIADSVVAAADRQRAVSEDLARTAEQVEQAGEASASAGGSAASLTERQRALTEQLRGTAQSLDAAARSLDGVVSRFGAGTAA